MCVDFKARSLDEHDGETAEADGNILVPRDDGITEFFHLAHSNRATGRKERVKEEKEQKDPHSWLILSASIITSRSITLSATDIRSTTISCSASIL